MDKPEAAKQSHDLILGDLDTVYQVSTYGALFSGVLDGFVPIKDLRPWGNFGIGSITGLHGEVLILDGVIYHFNEYGKAQPVGDEERTPKMLVSFFKTDQTVVFNKASTYEEVQSEIEKALPTPNIMYAVKIRGCFERLRTKCYPAQTKPYPKGIGTALTKHVREYENVHGTLVGYIMPGHLGDISGLNYHFHFVTFDGEYGGHMIDFSLHEGTAYLDHKHTLQLLLPKDEAYYEADLSSAMETLHQVVDISLRA